MLIDMDTPGPVIHHWILGTRGKNFKKRSTLLDTLNALNMSRAVPPREKRTPVLLLARNAVLYVHKVLPRLMAVVAVAFANARVPPPRFYIYENDSDDGTAKALAALHSSDVVVCLDRVPKNDRPRGIRGDSRCAPMARMRNALCALASRDLQGDGYALYLDTDMWISTVDLTKLITMARVHEYDITTPLTMYGEHYFDTYALLLEDEIATDVVKRVDCPLASCIECPDTRRRRRVRAPRGPIDCARPIVPVKSAFGGACVIRKSVLRERPWRHGDGLCEHVWFCRSRRVCIVPSVHARWVPKCTDKVVKQNAALLKTSVPDATPKSKIPRARGSSAV